MFFACFEINQNVIQIYHAYVIYQLSQNFIDQCLKRNKSIDKLERYNCIFEMIITDAKRRHSLVALIFFNSMIYILKIELNKICNAHKMS